MTTQGYDSRAVKVPKSIKRRAARILDAHQRGDFIRSYVEIIQANSRANGRRQGPK